MAVKKYFIGILIPEPLFGKIEAIKRSLFEERGLKGGLRSPSHITLHRPFEWKEEKEELLIEQLSSFRSDSGFEIGIKDFGFFEPRVIYAAVLPNEQLAKIHEALKTFAQRELKQYNELNDLRGFHPHVTLAFRDLKKPTFYELQKEFTNRTIEGRFVCDNFSLFKFNKTWIELKQFSL